MVLLFFLLSYIAWCDITKRKIYNKSVILLFITIFFVKVVFNQKLELNNFISGFSSFLICFLVFIIFYCLKWMAAGDVKLGAVLAFFFGMQDFFVVWIISIALALGYVALVKIAYMAGWEVLRQKLTFKDVGKKYVPYGALLCFASMFFILKMEDIL